MPSSGQEVAVTSAHTVTVPPPRRVSVYVVGPGPLGPTAFHETVTARVLRSTEFSDEKSGAAGVAGAPADWPVTWVPGPGPLAFTASTVNVYWMSLSSPGGLKVVPVVVPLPPP